MYTFDYKDEQSGDPSSDDCISILPNETVETEIEKSQDPSGIVDDAEEHIISDRGNDQPALFSSVRVYAIADKYDIPNLKELARQRFCDWAEEKWACEDFPAIAREIFETTPNKDRGLRDVVVRLVALHADSFTKNDKSRQLIEEIGELGLSVLCQLLKTYSQEKKGLKSRVKALEAETAVLNIQLKDCERDTRRKSDDMNSTISKINSLVECRHCKNELNVEVESYMYGAAIVRCKRCRTRH